MTEEMDKEAVLDAIGCPVGPDCLKDVLPKYRLRIKVYKAIKAALKVTISQKVCMPNYMVLLN